MVHLKSFWGHTFFGEAEEEYCPVYNAIFDAQERLIVTGGEDGKVKVWSRETGGLVSTLQGHKNFINKICVTRDNRLVLSAAQDGVRFFDLRNMSSMGGFQT
jgi:WD40 repeat protein